MRRELKIFNIGSSFPSNVSLYFKMMMSSDLAYPVCRRFPMDKSLCPVGHQQQIPYLVEKCFVSSVLIPTLKDWLN